MSTVAFKTMEAIEAAINKDGGAGFRQALEIILPKMADAYAGKSDRHRSHFGYSNAGESCGRKLWYSWNWVKAATFPARVLRLFNRGHLEEARFLALLVCAGFEVYYETEEGGQFRISGDGGHSGSALDGVVVGIPDLPPGTPALVEMKTHSLKSFNEVVRKKLREGKYIHYVQMQIYMKKYDLKWGLYMAVHKDTDELYCELIPSDPAIADKMLNRVSQLIYTKTAPNRVNDSPSWFECKFCDYRLNCHNSALPEINCRTCIYSAPQTTGGWICNKYNTSINKADMLQGCSKHLMNPELIEGIVVHATDLEAGTMEVDYKRKRFILGKGGISSTEFINKNV
jgi:hypothetical protein